MAPENKVVEKKLGEILVSRGLITADQLKEALELQKKDPRLIGELLVELKYVTQESIAWALTVQYGFPYLPLKGYQIDREVIKLVPEEFARKHDVIAIDKIGSVFTVAMADPQDQEVTAEVQKLTGCTVQIFISTLAEVREMIDKYYAKPK
jgi:type IV pilus assembly protein PilB